MSSWSVESRGSAQTTSSSEAGSERPSPNVSRNASFQSSGAASSMNSLINNGHPPSATSATTTTAAVPSTSQPIVEVTTIQSQPASPEKKAESIQQQQQSSNSSSAAEGGSSNNTSKRSKKVDAPKTVITLMGGRGYINWRRAAVEKTRTSHLAQLNNSDAFLVIWEMKL